MVLTQKTIWGIRLGNATITKIHKGTSQLWPTYIPWSVWPWVYWNQAAGLISISSYTGNNWITIADKNLWATQVYHEWDTYSQANMWYWYQWWNNYSIPYDKSWITYTEEQRDVSSYWPGNYYSSSTIMSPYWEEDWANPHNNDLWWGETWTKAAMQWPCPSWFNIWDTDDWWRGWQRGTITSYASTMWILSTLWTYLFMPSVFGENVSCFTATPMDDDTAYHIDSQNWGLMINSWTPKWRYLCHIRPIKNEPVIPDSTWTALFEFNPVRPTVTFDHWDTDINVWEHWTLVFRYENASSFSCSSDDSTIANTRAVWGDDTTFTVEYEWVSAWTTYMYWIAYNWILDTWSGVEVTVH